MLQPSDLQRLGVQLSEEFLQRGENMTDGLQKIASQHALNPHQVQRIAETANVRTHLEMLKTASPDTAYIKFPLADAAKISSVDIEKISHTLAYSLKPETD